jgi:phospholipid N-methyltransferase
MPDSKRKFWKQFLKSRREIGSVTPSSRHLTKGIIDKIDFSADRIIVELGPGTGVFTQSMLDKMSPNSRLVVIELNDEMFQLLGKKIHDDRVILVHGSATMMKDILSNHGLNHVDYIVSSLPLSVMPPEIANQIFQDSKTLLSSHGKYIQFMYSLVLKAKLQEYFHSVSKSFVLFNFPPAFVFECHNYDTNG